MNKLWLAPFFLIFFSCVGTVQDTDIPKTVIQTKQGSSFTFAGVSEAYGISQDKIEVFFYPATGGNGKFDYIIFVGDLPIPYSVPSDVLIPDYLGRLKFTVTGLEQAQAYVIKVEARDQTTQVKLTNDETTMASTFSNQVADFSGISSVSNPQGVDGLDSIKVRWAHAYYNYADLTNTTPTDPVSYEITALNSDLLKPNSFHDRTKGEADGRYVKLFDYNQNQSDVTLRGLPSGKKYYVRVRAIHRNSFDDVSNDRLRGEKNTNYLEISTLSSSTPEFNTNSVLVTKNSGIAVTSSLIVSWGTVNGVFDHFRLYYQDVTPGIVTNPPSFSEANIASTCISGTIVGGFLCKKVDSNSLSATIANLNALSTYRVYLVVCQDIQCTNKLISLPKTGTTTPTLGGFTGIKSISTARNVNEVGKLTLNYSVPDFTLGYFDGFVIAFKTDVNFVANPDLITEDTYTGTITYDSFNYVYDNSITVNNVSYFDGITKCFNISPFVYNANQTKTWYNNEKWSCVVPTILAPNKDEFTGFRSGTPSIGTVSNPGNIFFRWTKPSSGVFTKYEIIYKKVSSVSESFNFSTAISEINSGGTTNYKRLFLSDYLEEYTLPNLVPGTYKIGILTYYLNPLDATNSVYRSEYNDRFLTCEINAVGGTCDF
jgi:hypothetical protein